MSLLIARELAIIGAQGLNSLASSLPGRIFRSVLTEKRRKLDDREPCLERHATRDRAG